jgi:hypothetical protein
MFGTVLLSMGAGLILGGLMELIMPQPRPSGPGEASKYLGAQGNTTRIGTPIPILAGRHKVFGQWFSFNVDAFDSAGGGGDDGGGGGDGGIVGGPNTQFLFANDPPGKPRNIFALWSDPNDGSHAFQPHYWGGDDVTWISTGTWVVSEGCFAEVSYGSFSGTRVYVQAADLPGSVTDGPQQGYLSINSATRTAKIYLTSYGWLSVETIDLDSDGTGSGGTVGDSTTRVIFSEAIPDEPANHNAAWLDPNDPTHAYQPHNWVSTAWVPLGTWVVSESCFVTFPFEGGSGVRVYVQAQDLPNSITDGPKPRYLSVNTSTNVVRIYVNDTTGWTIIKSLDLDEEGGGGSVGTATTAAIIAANPPGQPANPRAIWLDKDMSPHPYQPYEWNSAWFVPATCAWVSSELCWSYTPLGGGGANRFYVLTVDYPPSPTDGPQQGYLCVNTTTNQVRMYSNATASWNPVEVVNV